MTSLKNKRVIDEYRRWLQELCEDADLFVTLVVEGNTPSPASMAELLRTFEKEINATLIGGSRWWKRKSQHIQFCAALEGVDVRPHWHMVLTFCRDLKPLHRAAFKAHASQIWLETLRRRKLSGEFHMRGGLDIGAIDYILKTCRIDLLEFDYGASRQIASGGI